MFTNLICEGIPSRLENEIASPSARNDRRRGARKDAPFLSLRGTIMPKQSLVGDSLLTL